MDPGGLGAESVYRSGSRGVRGLSLCTGVDPGGLGAESVYRSGSRGVRG